MKEQKLIEELKSCFYEWGSDFDIDVQEEECFDSNTYFSVIVAHESLGHDYEFAAKISDDGVCQMDYFEDSWQPINMGNMFAFMWFDTATQRETKG